MAPPSALDLWASSSHPQTAHPLAWAQSQLHPSNSFPATQPNLRQCLHVANKQILDLVERWGRTEYIKQPKHKHADPLL